MKLEKCITYSAITAAMVAVAFLAYIVIESKALSYLSHDAKPCINCHVMNAQYASWQHSSHASRATCVDCHLPTDSFVKKYLAKARDGFNHSYAFTTNSYDPRIQISEDGANRVQDNCIRCHATLTQVIRSNADKYHDFSGTKKMDRRCWECHRSVPHGEAHSIISSPNNLGARELK